MPEGKIAGFEKKTVLIAAIIVVVVIGGYYFVTHSKKKKSASSKSNASAQYVAGTLTAQDANSLTIKTADGSSQTVTLAATSRISKKNKKIQIANIPVGDQLKIKVTGSGSSLSAVVIEDTSAESSAAGTKATTTNSVTPTTTPTTTPSATTAPAAGATVPISTPATTPTPVN